MSNNGISINYEEINKIIFLPVASMTGMKHLVVHGSRTTETMTNKTLVDHSNNIAANSIWIGSQNIVVPVCPGVDHMLVSTADAAGNFMFKWAPVNGNAIIATDNAKLVDDLSRKIDEQKDIIKKMTAFLDKHASQLDKQEGTIKNMSTQLDKQASQLNMIEESIGKVIIDSDDEDDTATDINNKTSRQILIDAKPRFSPENGVIVSGSLSSVVGALVKIATNESTRK